MEVVWYTKVREQSIERFLGPWRKIEVRALRLVLQVSHGRISRAQDGQDSITTHISCTHHHLTLPCRVWRSHALDEEIGSF